MLLDNNRRNPSHILPSEITPPEIFHNRRHFLQLAGFGLAAGALLGARSAVAASGNHASGDPAKKIIAYTKTKYGVGESLTPYKDITTYNNFYEFGTGKADPAIESVLFKPQPWSIRIEGAVNKPKTINIEDLLKLASLEERIYRMRCVEGWSMVIPWIGLPLMSLIKWAQPLSTAKYVEFVSASDPQTMPGVRMPMLAWPYTEGLRIDEAYHPLTLLAVGLYGEVLPNQNGAPVRLVVPWKYGFKGAKSIVAIRFVQEMPVTTWVKANPQEYGFYANVNPHIDHPRWTQSSEKPIGAGLFAGRIKTKMFNGYEEVAALYTGIDLKKYF